MTDPHAALRQRSPSAERNREPILAVLRDVLPATGRVLEIAAGTGQHAICFAAALPGLDWQPSDADADARASIAAWTAHAALGDVCAPPSNDAFDQQLRSRNPAWGVRDMETVVALGASLGLSAEEPIAMPANNFSLVFRKR